MIERSGSVRADDGGIDHVSESSVLYLNSLSAYRTFPCIVRGYV